MKLIKNKIFLYVFSVLAGAVLFSSLYYSKSDAQSVSRESSPKGIESVNLVTPLGTPTGKVILSVDGNINHKNYAEGAQFDLAMLQALPQKTIVTQTPWTTGEVTFEGPTLGAIIEQVSGLGTTIESTALNGYKIKIPRDDVTKFDPILALKLNGKVLSVREKGPSWVIYPWSEMPKLQTKVYYTRSIWQIKSLTLTD